MYICTCYTAKPVANFVYTSTGGPGPQASYGYTYGRRLQSHRVTADTSSLILRRRRHPTGAGRGLAVLLHGTDQITVYEPNRISGSLYTVTPMLFGYQKSRTAE